MPKKWITGIDIGRHSTKAVTLICDGEQFILDNYVECKSDDAIYTDGHSLKHQPTVKILAKLRKITPKYRNHVALILPSGVVHNRLLSLPSFLSTQEVENALGQKLQQLMPQLSQGLEIDFSSLPCPDNSQQRSHLVHFSQTSVIETWLKPCEEVGYKVVLLQPHESAATGLLQTIAHQMPAYKRWGLLELGLGHITFYPPSDMPIETKASWSIPLANNRRDLADWLTVSEVMKINAHIQQVSDLSEDGAIEGLWLCGGGATHFQGELFRTTQPQDENSQNQFTENNLFQNERSQTECSQKQTSFISQFNPNLTIKKLVLEELIFPKKQPVNPIPPQFMLATGCAINALTWRAGERYGQG
ncbi:pilus assembly protein PilM [Vibrio hippocampi]|uniref:Pilus assembly protein PilM n=1 Tax=Vibrio hippocampi TaxID=654686 RepID=A0ABM8ZF83_9VIBR|nr:pilus assembly protein PilM [Vibrio hippocampi]CAH0524546.1 hypothetical protein VHP8226_00384 [Vibrio hippocampi]